MEWAQVRALAADGISQREIAARLGINRGTVARLAAADEPPRCRRASQGSQLDPLEPVLRRLLEEWPQIKAPRLTEILRDDYGYTGSLRLVQERLRELRPRQVRPAQRTGYRPGQVLQLDWAELPTRPRIAGRERRVYALIAALPYSGAQTAFFSLDLMLESFLEGHVRALEWLGGVPRECVYDNHLTRLSSLVPEKREQPREAVERPKRRLSPLPAPELGCQPPPHKQPPLLLQREQGHLIHECCSSRAAPFRRQPSQPSDCGEPSRGDRWEKVDRDRT
ncbi:MAG: transposase [Rhodospirillales bacterium]|nr:transposase [Rhodospirillales bacterium]